MKILVTGYSGFIGKNLVARLENKENIEILKFNSKSSLDELEMCCKECDFVFNLAGVNRPHDVEEFMEGNYTLLTTLVECLERSGNTCPIVNTSSIQAKLENPYGLSKKAGEDMLFEYGEKSGSRVFIYRLPNVFGKWCRPNYNSVVATFCYNVAHNLPITVNDRGTLLNLVYIDDVIDELLQALDLHPHVNADGYCYVPNVYEVTLGEIVNLIYSFKESRINKMIPNLTDQSFEKKLYSTYLSYLPESSFAYPLDMHVDERGSFTEIIKSLDRGQVSINISKPGITKGNHWHNTKNEKFIVVSGNGLLRFRKHNENNVIQYEVSGKKLEVVDIPPGYTHSITNVGSSDMVTLIWCNECFDAGKPDTFYEEI